MTGNLSSDYKKLLKRNKDQIVLGTAEAIVQWDMETKMPPKAVEMRSQQLALLSRIHHKMSTSRETGKLLNVIQASPQYDTLSEIEKRNVYLIKKNYDEQTRLPEELVAEIAKQQAITVNIWKKAKAAKNFALLRPELEKLVNLNKRAAQLLMPIKEAATPYEALIDNFEPKMTTQAITTTFNQLQQGLAKLIEKIQDSPNQPDTSILHTTVPVEAQRKISEAITQTLGYDTASPKAGGRIDETEHPFTSGYYDDVRITTHYYPENYASSIFSVLHEAGHALYEQGLPQEWKYQPVGTTCSYGIHESQSRFIENIIGRSQEFWTYFLPKLKRIAGKDFSDLKLNPFVHAINRVKPSKIRVEADEVTYCLHVIIRFNLERDLFTGRINVKELPDLWNQNYMETLGVKIENDSEGVMQDTHWAIGLMGYFPCYALGNVYSGQILEAMQKANPNWRANLAKGVFTEVENWLVKNVHSYGDLYDAPELIRKISGKDLNVKPYLNYLNQKYADLYGF